MTQEQFNNLYEDMQGLVNVSYYDDYLFDCKKEGTVAVPFEEFIAEIDYRGDTGLTYSDERFAKYNPHDVLTEQEEDELDETIVWAQIREDLREKFQFSTQAGHQVDPDTRYKCRWINEGEPNEEFQIECNGEWESIESIDFEFSNNNKNEKV